VQVNNTSTSLLHQRAHFSDDRKSQNEIYMIKTHKMTKNANCFG